MEKQRVAAAIAEHHDFVVRKFGCGAWELARDQVVGHKVYSVLRAFQGTLEPVHAFLVGTGCESVKALDMDAVGHPRFACNENVHGSSLLRWF